MYTPLQDFDMRDMIAQQLTSRAAALTGGGSPTDTTTSDVSSSSSSVSGGGRSVTGEQERFIADANSGATSATRAFLSDYNIVEQLEGGLMAYELRDKIKTLEAQFGLQVRACCDYHFSILVSLFVSLLVDAHTTRRSSGHLSVLQSSS